jgi:hypothetical protein
MEDAKGPYGKSYDTLDKDASLAREVNFTPVTGSTSLPLPDGPIKKQQEEVFTPKLSVLQEAQKIIYGERNESYGDPADNHGTTAELFNAFIKRKYGEGKDWLMICLDAEDVCWFNVFQKISREAHCSKRDNLIDIAGYVGNIEMMQEEK